MSKLSRRSLFQLAGLSTAAGASALAAGKPAAQTHAAHTPPAGGHLMGAVGRVTSDIFNPTTFLRAWNFSDLPAERRAKFYHETPRPDGTLLREYQMVAVDREIEIAPGIFFPAWTYNGQVPGPTLRATYLAQELLTTFEGDLGEVALVPGSGGVFDVRLDGDRVWSRAVQGGFPDPKAVKQAVRDVIDPDRSLGHSDR